jgi:hypothetical protein
MVLGSAVETNMDSSSMAGHNSERTDEAMSSAFNSRPVGGDPHLASLFLGLIHRIGCGLAFVAYAKLPRMDVDT